MTSAVWSARRPTPCPTGPRTATSPWSVPLNDRAYGYGTDSFTRALGVFPEGASHVYVASDDGEPVGCLLMSDHDGNSDVEMVAVLPEARGRGISGNLLRHALADAAERGCDSSTLVSTELGYPRLRAGRLPPARPNSDVGAHGELLIRRPRRSPRT